MRVRRLSHHVVDEVAELARLRDPWSKLMAGATTSVLPLCWEWFDAWWGAFGSHSGRRPLLRLAIHVFEDDRGLRAIVPMCVTNRVIRGIKTRVLMSLANDYSPLWDAVTAGDLDDSELEQIAEAVFSTPRIEIFQLSRLASNSRLGRWIAAQGGKFGHIGICNGTRVPVADTTEAWLDFVGRQPAKYRKNTRKKLRVFEAALDAKVRYLPILSGEDPLLDEAVDISNRSWKKGIGRDLGSDDAGLLFLRRLISHIGPRGGAGLWVAETNGRSIAFELHVKGFGVTYPIRADMDQAYRELSPGSVVEYHAIKAAFEDPAINAYDSCASDYWYLRRLTEGARFIHDIEVFPRRLKSSGLYAFEYLAKPRLTMLNRHRVGDVG
jgi:CelD/BcsL family acetyltransferase involved in cellulose biosynthesis